MQIISILASAVAGLDLGAYCTQARSSDYHAFITVDPTESTGGCAKGVCLRTGTLYVLASQFLSR